MIAKCHTRCFDNVKGRLYYPGDQDDIDPKSGLAKHFTFPEIVEKSTVEVPPVEATVEIPVESTVEVPPVEKPVAKVAKAQEVKVPKKSRYDHTPPGENMLDPNWGKD